MNPEKILNATLKEELEGIKKSLELLGTKQGQQNLVALILDALKGKDGTTPEKGKDYFDGNDGKTPEKFKDYFTKEDIEQVVTLVREKIKIPQSGKDFFTADDKKKMIVELKKFMPKVGKDFFTATDKVQMRDKLADILEKRVKKITADTLNQVLKAIDDPDKIEKIARGIEKLKGDKRLDARKLKNLPRPGAGGGVIINDRDDHINFDLITVSATAPASPSLNDLWYDIA